MKRTQFVATGLIAASIIGIILFAGAAVATAQSTGLSKSVQDQIFARLKQLQDGAAKQQVAINSLEQRVSDLEAVNLQQASQILVLQQQVAAFQGGAGGCGLGQVPVCCEVGQDFCSSGGCVDLDTDTENCGECGIRCSTGDVCVAGTCLAGCSVVSDCGMKGDVCASGLCACGGGGACGAGTVCNAGVCSVCGNGNLDPGEDCDDGNLVDNDGCTNACTFNECAPSVIFGLGVFGTTSCAQRCQSEGKVCLGIGSDEGGANGQYFKCAAGANSGTATSTAPGTCSTVFGGNGCSEYGYCRCAPVAELDVIFAVGIFGTTSCNSRCQSEGGTCLGIGTNDTATNGMYYECFGQTSGVATQTAQGTCATVLGGQGCSEYTSCRCLKPTAECTESVFGVGIFGTTTCASRCQSEGGVCVGLGTDTDGLNGLYNSCPAGQNSGIATTTSPGTCTTVLGGNGCSEYAYCRCYFE